MTDLKKKIAAAIERTEQRMSKVRYTGPPSRREPYDDYRKQLYAAQAEAALHVIDNHK